MIFVWGKRSYGAVETVGNISIKTVFGHLWYLPLFPMASYYVHRKTDAAYELNKINWRSVSCGYIRMWVPLFVLVGLIGMQEAEPANKVIIAILMALGVGAVAGSYVLDKKKPDPHATQLRQMMERHFGVALDPHACLTSLQNEIDDQMRTGSDRTLEENWYKQVMKDGFAHPRSVELALLRARCDQHDKPLQQTVLQQLQRVQRSA